MAYSHFMEQGRLPHEIDNMSMEDYLSILRFRAWEKREEKEPQDKHIEDFI